MPLSNALNYFCTFVPKGDNLPYTLGPALPPDTIETEVSDSSEPQPTTTVPSRIVKVPLNFLKMKVSSIVLTSIKDDLLKESVAAYHSIVGA